MAVIERMVVASLLFVPILVAINLGICFTIWRRRSSPLSFRSFLHYVCNRKRQLFDREPSPHFADPAVGEARFYSLLATLVMTLVFVVLTHRAG